MPNVRIGRIWLIANDIMPNAVVTAASVGEGIERLSQDRPDLVMCDLKLPDGTGLEVLQHARQQQLETPFIITDVPTAEMIKYTSNAFLAAKISFINEIANVCERVGADVHQVSKAMGLDGRISNKFLHPGPGFGGSCFPKDVSALVSAAEEVDFDFKIGKAVLDVNSRQRRLMIDKIVTLAGGVEGKEISFFGLAFKPNTDDMRDSPTIEIIKGLQEAGARIRAFDPAAMDNARHIFEDVDYREDAYAVADGADVLVVATEWNQFRSIDLDRIRKSMRTPVVVDMRNIYDPDRMRELGFTYDCVGRPGEGRKA